MILCKYSELRRYAAVLPHLEAALECAAKVCAEGLKEGRREFEGGYLSVQTGRTAPLADGHMPCRCVGEAKDYQKIVIKLRMDSPKA